MDIIWIWQFSSDIYSTHEQEPQNFLLTEIPLSLGKWKNTELNACNQIMAINSLDVPV